MLVMPPRGASTHRRSKRHLTIAPVYAAVVPALLVGGVAFALYARTLFYPFLNWDDPTYVMNNPWIRSWSWGNLTNIFTRPYAANFLPIHLLSYMLDYSIWGLDPFGYHMQSIILHSINTVLVLQVTRRLFRSTWLAFLAALLFAVHPAQVEVVAWISARKDLLATMFGLLSVLFYLRATDQVPMRRTPYLLSVVTFALALLSKAAVVTLPLFLVLLDRVCLGNRRSVPWKEALISKIPFAAAGVVAVVLNTWAQTKAQADYARDPIQYAAVKGEAAWRYVGLLLGVARGSPDYDLPNAPKTPVALLRPMLGLTLFPLGALAGYFTRSRVVLLGFGWIFLMLIPALAFPLVTFMADRYLYAPSIGACWMVAAGIVAIAHRVKTSRPKLILTAATALAVVVASTTRTTQALPIWRSSESLWSYALTRCNDWRVYANLAEVDLEQRRFAEAEQLLNAVADVDNPTIYQNFGVLYFYQGRYPEALAATDRALGILRKKGWDPTHASVLYYSLGAIHARMGRTDKAIEALESSLRENPGNSMAREQLAALRIQRSPKR